MYTIDSNQNIIFIADIHLKTNDKPALEKVLNFLDDLKKQDINISLF